MVNKLGKADDGRKETIAKPDPLRKLDLETEQAFGVVETAGELVKDTFPWIWNLCVGRGPLRLPTSWRRKEVVENQCRPSPHAVPPPLDRSLL